MKCTKCGNNKHRQFKYLGTYDEWLDNVIRARWRCNKCGTLIHKPTTPRGDEFN